MSRLLLVSFQQAIRSITLALLPIAFLSLLVWATAGSSSGNTADPLRAAVWIFLAAHHVPLQLSLSNQSLSGLLSFLPLGALLIPYLTARSGYKRLVERLGAPNQRTKRLYVLDYALSYSIVTYLVALPTISSAVYVPFYIAIPIVFLVSALFTYVVSGIMPRNSQRLPWQQGLRFAWIAFNYLLGFSILVFTASLAFHFSTTVKLTEVIAPGIIGGIAFLLIQVSYFPNIAITTLSYLSGAGVTVGDGTLISPFTHRINEIPALPVLGALPVTNHLWHIIFALAPVAVGFVMAQHAIKNFSDLIELKRFLLVGHGALFVIASIAGLIAGGQLLSSNLSFVGPLWWLMPLVLTLESALGALVSIGVPILVTRIRMRP